MLGAPALGNPMIINKTTLGRALPEVELPKLDKAGVNGQC